MGRGVSRPRSSSSNSRSSHVPGYVYPWFRRELEIYLSKIPMTGISLSGSGFQTLF